MITSINFPFIFALYIVCFKYKYKSISMACGITEVVQFLGQTDICMSFLSEQWKCYPKQPILFFRYLTHTCILSTLSTWGLPMSKEKPKRMGTQGIAFFKSLSSFSSQIFDWYKEVTLVRKDMIGSLVMCVSENVIAYFLPWKAAFLSSWVCFCLVNKYICIISFYFFIFLVNTGIYWKQFMLNI